MNETLSHISDPFIIQPWLNTIKLLEMKAGDRNRIPLSMMKIEENGAENTQEKSPYVARLREDAVLGKGDLALVLQVLDAETSEVNPNLVLKLLDFGGNQYKAVGPEQSHKLIVDEARLLQECQHPNIAKFAALVNLRLSERTQLPAIVRENLPQSLADYLEQQGGKLEVKAILELLRGLSTGMTYLREEKKLIYTDASMNNIRLREVGGEMIPVIADLNYIYPVGTVLGNSGYSEDLTPPELASMNGERLANPKMQVWQLASLAQQLAGGLPFSEEHLVMGDEISVKPDVDLPEGVKLVIDQALQKDPEKRPFQNPEEFMAALELSLAF